MPKKSKRNPDHALAEAALRLAAKLGWNGLTPATVARAAGGPKKNTATSFARIEDLLPLITRLIDDRTKERHTIDPNGSPHDRIFEIMMARFDTLQERRAGVLALLEGIRKRPVLLRCILPNLAQSMSEMLRLAGLETSGPRQHFLTAGLVGIYGLTLKTWRTDTSPDMAKTMSVLDRNLRRAGRIAETIFRGDT